GAAQPDGILQESEPRAEAGPGGDHRAADHRPVDPERRAHLSDGRAGEPYGGTQRRTDTLAGCYSIGGVTVTNSMFVPANDAHERSVQAEAGMLCVEKVRLAWGLALLCQPSTLIGSTGVMPTRMARNIARLLGVRHVVQALGLRVLGTAVGAAASRRAGLQPPRVRRAGAAVDAAHALSAFALAASGHARSAWAADGLIASTFAFATWRTADD